MMLKFAIPVLHVTSSPRRKSFIVRSRISASLCVSTVWRRDPCYMGVTRDDVELHLSSFSGDGVAGGVVFVGSRMLINSTRAEGQRCHY
jgi:hypothetical protein